MFFLFRLAAAAHNLLHVGCRTRSPWPHCQPPWTERQQAASDTGASGALVLAPMEGDGTWKGEMLREEDKAYGGTRAQVCTIHVCLFLTMPTTLKSCKGQGRDG